MKSHGHIHHVCRSPQTGVWTVMKTLARWQEREQPGSVAIIVVADDTWPHRDELGDLGIRFTVIDIPRLPHGYALPYLLATRIWRRIDKAMDPPGIAHYHDAWMASALIGRRVRQPSVVTVHGVPWEGYIDSRIGRAALHRLLANLTVRSGATMVSVDREAVKAFSNLFHTPETAFMLVPNGVEDTSAVGCPRLRGEEQFTVGFLGGLEDRKGWEVVCKAVEMLAQGGENIRLLIAGDGSQDAQGSVRRSCASIGNGSEYLGLVRRASDSVVPLLDALALPSKAEGVPMAVLECLCAHVPIICTPVGGLGSLLTNGRDCIYVERNPASVAGAIKTMILDANLHRDMSFNARATYEQFGSVTQMGLGYSNVYEAATERWLQGHGRSE